MDKNSRVNFISSTLDLNKSKTKVFFSFLKFVHVFAVI